MRIVATSVKGQTANSDARATMGADLWAFVIVSLVAAVLFVWMLCEAASQAGDALREMARERELRERQR